MDMATISAHEHLCNASSSPCVCAYISEQERLVALQVTQIQKLERRVSAMRRQRKE